MNIDKSYKVNKDKYYSEETTKHQIVIGHTYSSGMDYVKCWDNRIGGKYKSTVPYTIDIDGTVYEHYNSKFYSDFIYDEADKYIIPINLVNEGWLETNNKKKYFNRFNCIYNREDVVFNKEWRGRKTWAPYSKKQIDALVELCVKLCKKHRIPLKCIHHNTKSNTVKMFNGITFRSNYDKLFKDISPAFDIEYFVKKIKEYE